MQKHHLGTGIFTSQRINYFIFTKLVMVTIHCHCNFRIYYHPIDLKFTTWHIIAGFTDNQCRYILLNESRFFVFCCRCKNRFKFIKLMLYLLVNIFALFIINKNVALVWRSILDSVVSIVISLCNASITGKQNYRVMSGRLMCPLLTHTFCMDVWQVVHPDLTSISCLL